MPIRQPKPDKNEPVSEPVTSNVSGRAGHSQQVMEWRVDQFRHLGFSLSRAQFLADTHIELGRARKMRAQGCSHDLLEEILLGTNFAGEDEHWYKSTITYEEETDDGA